MNGKSKKKILVIDDNTLNREILKEILCDIYEIHTASNGYEALRILNKPESEYSLILLDVYMPVCDGFQFLKLVRQDPYLSSIPIIVTTSSDRTEDKKTCLGLGALEFITKPYHTDNIVGRIDNVIRLRESLAALSIVQYDEVTRLYNFSAFKHYASLLLKNTDDDYDMVVIMIQDYSYIINVFGYKKTCELLEIIAARLRAAGIDGLVASNESGFYILVKSSERMAKTDYFKICEEIQEAFTLIKARLKTGVYLNVDKNLPFEIIFGRAKSAMKTIMENEFVSLVVYDSKIEESILNDNRIVMNYDQAIFNEEFKFYLQPKVDIKSGKIIGAEALVRWFDGDHNFISPGSFIPVLESADLIYRLDEYVFRKVCEYQRRCIISGKGTVPISVNLSRSSLFRSGMAEKYLAIARENGVNLSLVPLEITESAIVSDRIINQVCNKLHNLGFTLHLDDFGNGYSSLSSIATLPLSFIKFDKSIIDEIENEKGAIIIEGFIATVKALGMKIVAEGVENVNQLKLLTRFGCDYVQGFLFSPAVSPGEFETLLYEKEAFASLLNDNHLHDPVTIEDKQVCPLCKTGYEGACRTIMAKIIDEQRDSLQMLKSITRSYLCVYHINLESDEFNEITDCTNPALTNIIGRDGSAREKIQIACKETVVSEQAEDFRLFIDMDTLADRLQNCDSIAMEFLGVHFGWCLGEFFVVNRKADGRCDQVILAIRSISEKIALQESERQLLIDLKTLHTAVDSVFPRVTEVNLTKNTFKNLTMDGFMKKEISDYDDYDQMLRHVSHQVPDNGQRELFLEHFSRDAQLEAFYSGKKKVSYIHQQLLGDGQYHWLHTQVVFVETPGDDVMQVSFARFFSEECNSSDADS